MDLINFNVRISNGFLFNDFLFLLKEVSYLFCPQQITFEYTRGQELHNSRFTNYLEFDNFYNDGIRFDLLKLERDEDFVGFQNSQDDLRIFGKVKTTLIINSIVQLLKGNIIFGYAHSDFDLTLSRNKNYRVWKRKLKEIPSYVEKINNPQSISERDKYLVNLESLPTYYHQINNGDKLWFGACAIMYFSELYYKYIPRAKWEKFTDCEENVVFENGLRKIVLYNDLSNFENVDNRNRQWAFRKKMKIDKISSTLK